SRRSRRVLHAVATVTGADGDGDALMVVGWVVRHLARELSGAVAVADLGRAVRRRRVHRGREIAERGRGSLHEEDLAPGTHGRDHVEVERDLLRPTGVGPWH